MPFTLVHLPVELLEMIALALTAESDTVLSDEEQIIFQLRLVCREARNKLETKFFYTYFTDRHLWLDDRKLAELDRLSQRADLADRVKRLLVIGRPDPDNVGDTFTLGRSMVAPSGVAASLSQILPRLKNLRELKFTDTMRGDTTSSDRGHNVGSAFAAVLLATESCKCTITALEFSSNNVREWRVVGIPDARSMLFLSPSLAGLERLHLSILCAPYLAKASTKYSSQASNVYESKLTVSSGSETGYELALALGRCTQLKDLSLRMLFTAEATTAFAAPASTLRLPELQKFELSTSSCTADTLGQFLLNHASGLRHLSLLDIKFRRTSPVMLTSMLDLLRKSLELHTFEAEHLRIYAGDGNKLFSAISFPALDHVYWHEDTSRDDYIVVRTQTSIHGVESVRHGLAQMKDCVAFTAYRKR
ncbi:hypothetical protein LTR17_001428 [Elasticomyces elasticus]|nr:hypothetical protein LTR17_001428 [Elasticomyces elasticus]